MVDEILKKRGRVNRARGKAFELRVREDLEKQGWIVDKWTNQVVFGIKSGKKILKGEVEGQPSQGHLVSCKPKFNPFTKALMMNSSGFPDFLAFKPSISNVMYEVIGVECKMGKYISAEEKQKCDWLLNNRKFSKILIASPGEKRGQILYQEYAKTSK
jgi:hypothetical protein